MGVFSLEIKRKKNSEQTALKWLGLGLGTELLTVIVWIPQSWRLL